MATSEDGSPSLTVDEVVRLVVNIISAGFETSASLIAATMYHVLLDPDLWESVKRDPEVVPAVVEEGLRFANPVRGLPRETTRDTVLAGVEIPQGSRVIVSIASAARDETVFESAEQFDPARGDAGEHLGFGRWTHFCLGAPLARMEGRIAIECLAERLPGLRLAAGESLQDRGSNRIASVVNALRVEWS